MPTKNADRLVRCKHCNKWINLDFGADSPAEHAGAAGTKTDPRSPGDWNDICDVCNYGKGLRGGPNG